MFTALLGAIEPTPGTLDVLDKVHGFYNDAWTQLMGVLLIAVAVMGVLVPVFILIGQALLERRREASFRLDKESMTREIASARSEFQALVRDTRNTLNKDIAANKKDLAEAKQEFNRSAWRSVAMSVHNSARGAEAAGMYDIALGHYATSINCELRGYAAEPQVRPCLEGMVRICGNKTWAQAARKNLHVLNVIREVLDKVKKAGISGESKEHIEFLEAFLVEAVSGDAPEASRAKPEGEDADRPEGGQKSEPED